MPNGGSQHQSYIKPSGNSPINNAGKNRIRMVTGGIKAFITGMILYYVFCKYIDFGAFLTAFKNVKPELLFVLLIITFAFRFLSSYQISYYLKKAYNIKVGTNYVFNVQLISSFYGMVLPGDLAGGLITWYMVSEKSGQKGDSAAVIIFLRLLSIITLIAFTAIGFVLEPKLIAFDLREYFILLTAVFFLMFIPFISSRAADMMKYFSRSIAKIAPSEKLRGKLIMLSDTIWDSVITCTDVPLKVILYTIFISVLAHILSIIFTYVLLIMVGINLPFQVSVWLLGINNIVQLLPISFAGMGVRDISMIYLLGELYRIKPESSEIVSTFFLAFTLIFVLMGAIAAWLCPSYKKQKMITP